MVVWMFVRSLMMILVAIVLAFDVALRVLFGRRRSNLVAVAFVVAVPVEILREDHENSQRFLVAVAVVAGRRRSTLVAVPVVAAYGWRQCHSILETVATTRCRRRRRRRRRHHRRRRRPADLLLVVVGPDLLLVVVGPDLLQVEILQVVVAWAAVASSVAHVKVSEHIFALLRVAIRFQTGLLLIRAHACASTSPFKICINLFVLM